MRRGGREPSEQQATPSRARPSSCRVCGYSLHGLSDTKCPECGRENAGLALPYCNSRLRVWVLWTVDAVLWVCVTVSLVLLSVFIWQWCVGGRMSTHTSVVILLAVPLIAQRLWNVGEEGLAEDRTLARSAFGVFGAAVVVGSQLAAAYVLFR